MPSDKPRVRNPSELFTLSPQARRVGFGYPVYCTHAVWHDSVIHPREDMDSRIFSLLTSLVDGLGKAMATTRADSDVIHFHHWRMPKKKEAKKARETQLSSVLFTDTDDHVWILIIDPAVDDIDPAPETP